MAKTNEDNMKIFDNARVVPATAQKKITGGNLNGFTDINPMWRYEKLTELFGPCGFGWYYEVTERWLEPGANGDVIAFVNINLYIKKDDEWSKPIPGNGGSSFISSNKNGIKTSDEAYKMATTDALSVACKVIGIGADVYWQNGAKSEKTTATPAQSKPTNTTTPKPETKRADVPVDEDLPEPKPAKAKEPPKPTNEEAEKAKAFVAPDGRTLGEIVANNPEEIKTVATSSKDKEFRAACLTVYNYWYYSSKEAPAA